MAQITAAGIGTAILTIWLRQIKPEYATYLSLAAGVFIFTAIITKMETVTEIFNQIEEYIGISPYYMKLLLKMLGITYLAELAADICKDAGCAAISHQIEIYGKLVILAVSMPIVLSLFELVSQLLSSS